MSITRSDVKYKLIFDMTHNSGDWSSIDVQEPVSLVVGYITFNSHIGSTAWYKCFGGTTVSLCYANIVFGGCSYGLVSLSQ